MTLGNSFLVVAFFVGIGLSVAQPSELIFNFGPSATQQHTRRVQERDQWLLTATSSTTTTPPPANTAKTAASGLRTAQTSPVKDAQQAPARHLQLAMAPTYASTHIRTARRVGGEFASLPRVPGWRYAYVPGRGYITQFGRFVPMQNMPYQVYPMQPGTNNYPVWVYGQMAFGYEAAPVQDELLE